MPIRTIEDIIGKCKNDNEKQRKIMKIVAKASFNFPYFVDKVLSFNKPDDFSKFHRDSMKTIPDQRFSVLIWPRGHLKTTIWSVAYILWNLWKNSGTRICVTSSELSQSQEIIEKIQDTIEENEFLKKLAPMGRKDTWNKSQLNTTNGNTCIQKPFSDSARGGHYDIVILDDVLRSKDITQNDIKDIFWSIFWPTIHTRRGQIIVVGTPMTKIDLLSELEKKKGWFVDRHAAVLEVNEKQIPLWENRFDMEELDMMREGMGNMRWQREYMTNPLAAGSSVFKNIKIGEHEELHAPRENCVYYLGVDIAMSEATESDFSVFCIVERDDVGMMRQVKQERYGPKSPIRTEDAIIKRLNVLHEIFNFRRIYVEDRGLSKGIVKTLLTPDLNPTSWAVLEGYRTARSGVRQSKENLVSRLEVAFLSNELEILNNQITLEELSSFKIIQTKTGASTFEGVGEHDDTVIALALAVMAATDKIGRASISFI